MYITKEMARNAEATYAELYAHHSHADTLCSQLLHQ